jgi:hypothetical protein
MTPTSVTHRRSGRIARLLTGALVGVVAATAAACSADPAGTPDAGPSPAGAHDHASGDAPSTGGPGVTDAPTDDASPVAGASTGFTDHATEPFQTAYLDGGGVVFEQQGPSPDGAAADANPLYEVEYPAGWQAVLPRPICDYCDHNGDGENAWDYHDHVLGAAPDAEARASGEVFWLVTHVRPVTTGDARTDEAIAEARPTWRGSPSRPPTRSASSSTPPLPTARPSPNPSRPATPSPPPSSAARASW